MEGKVIMWKTNADQAAKLPNSNVLAYQDTDGQKFYTHTMVITSVNTETGVITYNESNSPNGVREKTINKATINQVFKYFDIYELN